jgi:bacillithiol system protein YtxJ
VISLLGKFTAPRRAICYPEKMIIELRQNRDLEQLLEGSKTNPVLIFKHSTQCPISAYSYKEFMTFAESSGDLACGVVLVIENRRLSNTIEQVLNVQHESPQAIIVVGGRAVWHASHSSITADALGLVFAKLNSTQPQVNSNGEPAHQRD